jgi:hypothetical protein
VKNRGAYISRGPKIEGQGPMKLPPDVIAVKDRMDKTDVGHRQSSSRLLKKSDIL